MKPSILFIVPSEYETLKTKGVEKMIFERDEGGFFGKVITVHPFASKTQSITLNDCHEICEIGFDLVSCSERFGFLKRVQYPIHFIRILWNTIWLVKKYQINIIRAMDPFWIGFIAFLCSRICRVPFCVSIHADYDHMKKMGKHVSIAHVFGSYKLAKLLESFIFSKAVRVMPNRKNLGAKAEANGANPKKIRVIPHGIDLAIFDRPQNNNIRELFNLKPNVKIISFVGRFSKENYIDDIISIAKKLGVQREDYILVMVGGGEEQNRVKKEILEEPLLNKSVLITGFQPREVCYDLRRVSDVSLCLMAGFSLIEACAAGSPIVSYDVDWHSELVVDKETGFLLKEHDTDGVVSALDWILDHPTESEAMGRKAKSLAFECHDLAKTSAIKISCYSELLSQGEDH
tara:strand:+ start:1456 stop:2664 length:1209 start_codon:yes stop_codon:yes gene_type:complete